jgi:hypothetical protein
VRRPPAEEGVPFRDVAGVISHRLRVPVVSMAGEDAADHFGWLTNSAALGNPSSSTFTQRGQGWRPVGPALLPDLDRPRYFTSS